jgi:hypothetical protein
VEQAPQGSNLQPPAFGSPLLVTPALQSLLVCRDSALSQQRRRCWTTQALTLILALRRSRPARLLSADRLALWPDSRVPPERSPRATGIWMRGSPPVRVDCGSGGRRVC